MIIIQVTPRYYTSQKYGPGQPEQATHRCPVSRPRVTLLRPCRPSRTKQCNPRSRNKAVVCWLFWLPWAILLGGIVYSVKEFLRLFLSIQYDTPRCLLRNLSTFEWISELLISCHFFRGQGLNKFFAECTIPPKSMAQVAGTTNTPLPHFWTAGYSASFVSTITNEAE